MHRDTERQVKETNDKMKRKAGNESSLHHGINYMIIQICDNKLLYLDSSNSVLIYSFCQREKILQDAKRKTKSISIVPELTADWTQERSEE